MIDRTGGVSAIAGLTVENQSVAGVHHAAVGDLSISGFTIRETNPAAAGIVTQARIAQGTMLSLLDGEIVVAGSSQPAIANTGGDSLYLNDVYVKAPRNAIVNAGSTTVAASGQMQLIGEYSHADQNVNSGTSAGYANGCEIVIDNKAGRSDFGPRYGSTNGTPPADLAIRHLPGQMPWAFDANVAWVTDFGADPTGTVDSTTAIRQTIAAAHANGRDEVFLPRGNYVISGTLTLYPNTRFFGIPGGYAALHAPYWNTGGKVEPYLKVGDAVANAAGTRAGRAIVSDLYFGLPTLGSSTVSATAQSYLTAIDWQTGRSSVLNQVFAGFQYNQGLKVAAPARNIVQVDGTGGGRWYGLQIGGDYGPNASTGYQVKVANATAPLSIYGSNIEHAAGHSFYGFIDSANIRVLGSKTEGGSAPYWFYVEGSSNVMISGITNHGSSPTRVTDSTDVNIDATGFYAIPPSSKPYLIDDTASFPFDDNYALFKLGSFNDGVFPHCGDRVCDGGENATNCPFDC
jgi:hypothetical protein